MTSGGQIVQRIRAKHPWLTDADRVGVVASFAKDMRVDEERGNRDVIAVATTDDIDLEQEVVVPSGAATDYFFANRKVFVDHSYDIGSVAGTLRSASPHPSTRNHRGWLIRFRAHDTPLGSDVLTMAREGGVGVSIGFVALDYGRPTDEETKAYTKAGVAPKSVVRRWKWLETSVTAFPCNVACQTMESRVDDAKAAVIERLLTKGLIRRESAALVGFPVAPARRAVVCGW